MQPTPATDGADDLAILHPERRATIAGVAVVMREYAFIEGLKLQGLITPIADGMAALARAGTITDPDALRPVFGEHADSLLALIAAACDQPLSWVQSLSDEHGSQLQLLWWTVNAHFFGRRVVQSLLTQELRESAGRTFSSHSPAPATHPTASPATHAVN